jgi:hypothetical protein
MQETIAGKTENPNKKEPKILPRLIADEVEKWAKVVEFSGAKPD